MGRLSLGLSLKTLRENPHSPYSTVLLFHDFPVEFESEYSVRASLIV
jgi:hypothetical protein